MDCDWAATGVREVTLPALWRRDGGGGGRRRRRPDPRIRPRMSSWTILVATVVVVVVAVGMHDGALCPRSSVDAFSVRHARQRRPCTSTATPSRPRLFALSSTTPTTTPRTNAHTNVIFSTVVRPYSSQIGRSLFLGHLIEYLQDRFELPPRLPMVYNRIVVDNNNNNYHDDDDDHDHSIVVRWDSPLSPDASRTQLTVKVVGIVTTDDDGDDKDRAGSSTTTTTTAPHKQVPSMAMVVVEKANGSTIKNSNKNTANNAFPPMLANLFDDSERQILKALDRGLQEFMAGDIHGLGLDDDDNNNSNHANKDNANAPSQTRREGEASILAELLEDGEELVRGDPTTADLPVAAVTTNVVDADVVQRNGVAVDAEVVETMDETTTIEPATTTTTTTQNDPQHQQRQQQRDAAWNTMTTPTSKQSNTVTLSALPTGVDFAVQAAKRAQAKRTQRSLDDFAVQAAQKVVAAQQRQQQKQKTKPAVATDRPLQKDTPKAASKRRQSKDTNRSKSSDAVDPASLDLSQIRPPALDPPEVSGVKRAFMTTISTPKDYLKKSSKKSTTNAPSEASQSTPPSATTSQTTPPSKTSPKKKLNLNVRQNEKVPSIGSTADHIATEENDEIVKAAQDALNEMADNSQDLTPEELLSEIMKFDTQQEKEKQTGDGFVTGAFAKAKDLLREQKQQREARRDPSETKKVKVLTPDEELRQMFAAGERLADGRITATTTTSDDASSLSSTRSASDSDDELVDSWIDSDRSVSRHARILDDELAELEVRINKSPGESLDGPSDNAALFDIFSGPEVYNPNVDPETAVNWPGAQSGTKRIRLPTELDEAVKQANFALEVLLSMKETTDAVKNGSQKMYRVGNRELSERQVENLRAVVEEAVEIGLVDNPLEVQAEVSRLQMLLDELEDQPEERMRDITSNYKDLLLSDNFVALVKKRLHDMADRDLDALRKDDDTMETRHVRERELLGQLVVYAQLLLKEARALGAELEAQQLEVVRSICKVAMDPSHKTEEETAMALADAVRDMRPLLDDSFVAYLKYAVAEEEGRLARAGVLDDPEHNQWLFVLKIVQQGVYAEISKGINRYVEHIWYILRMETPKERRMLLEKLVDVMPTLDVRPFVQVVDNIVGSLGDSVRGEFDGLTPLGEMTNKLLQLHRDMKEVLPLERITEKSRDADEWAAKQKQRLLDMRKLSKQRLKSAQETEHLDAEIETMGRRSGEVERFD